MKNTKFLLVALLAISALSLSACSKNNTNTQNQVSDEPLPVIPETSQEVKDGILPGTVFNMADVSLHKSRTDCWTVIDGQIYDLTKYIASGEHKPIIVDGCGIDSTEMFNNIAKHSGKKAQDMLPGMWIGRIGQ